MLPSLIRKEPLFYACRLLSCSLLATAFSLSGCGLFDPEDRNTVIIVGTTRVTAGQFKKDMEYFGSDLGIPLQGEEAVRGQLIDRIIEHYLLLEYAKMEGVDLTEREFETVLKDIRDDYPENTFQEALLRGYVDLEQWKLRFREMLLVDKVVKRISEGVSPPSHGDVMSYFDENQEEFKSPRMVRFRQIVVESQEEAEKISERIRGGEDFESLAKTCSVAPEGEEGGEVGWVAKGQLEESMDKALFSLREQEISRVVKTPYGYHLFEVVETRPEGRKELPEVMHEIEEKLYLQGQETYYRDRLHALRDKIEVKVNDELIRKVGLP